MIPPFKLIKDGSSVRKHDPEILRATIESLTEDEDCFVILEPKHPIENSIYLQAVKENGTYLAEIRFVFGSDDNFKHYSRVYQSVEDIVGLFALYYTEAKVPDMKEWNDVSNSLSDEVGQMLKLYKTLPDGIHYWEIWDNDDNTFTIHQGKLGDVGETEVYHPKGKGLPFDVLYAQHISKQQEMGYEEIDNPTELIFQYTYQTNEDPTQLLEKRQYVESLLSDCLGWTGNGHCDGGDIGSGSMNIFCYVVDKDIALASTLEILEEEELLENLIVAYENEDTEEYITLYPVDVREFKL